MGGGMDKGIKSEGIEKRGRGKDGIRQDKLVPKLVGTI